MTAAALIVAAGRGTRAGGPLPKQYCPIGGRPLLYHTLARFAAHPAISHIQVVIHGDDRALYEEAASGLPRLLPPVPGGATRQASVLAGLEALAAQSPAPRQVLIHDGARPFISAGLISRVLDALEEAPGALPALAVTDTLRRGENGFCGETVPREGLWRAQTPQGFRFPDILAAHRAAAVNDMSDDVALASAAGLKVRLVEGSETNFKVTQAEDFARAETYLAAHMETRTGSGYDVHRSSEGSEVMLCGIAVPHSQSLAGHSDADVGLHAATDALLGALSDGDIGSHFPPSDPQWKGAASHLFLTHAAERMRARGGALLHLDVTLICERPKIGPHREAMRARLAEILDVPLHRISVKATTTEGLGFTGRQEGIAAQATATIRLPADEFS
ncbi:IspD/ispF bifunctional enzyme [Tepidicaulis marinus]|uniref:Bifunctional enzyme IspD/IspF n=1 Tax=Tepidicaulis marinus TaxID=1333998 RepID=A0A081B8W8_9HYPH|nr:bifunctional 2-C-methyl-D-erythritol 4-phosphate cytidylyltransferase/2-C-methyl-D-erythritol 2,4-cyclodiphosphate synthase [Tepidicaulis marinus]GAK44486.1 IspD/ispF bifunctional enzyme [Tepidicaulis marinus]